MSYYITDKSYKVLDGEPNSPKFFPSLWSALSFRQFPTCSPFCFVFVFWEFIRVTFTIPIPPTPCSSLCILKKMEAFSPALVFLEPSPQPYTPTLIATGISDIHLKTFALFWLSPCSGASPRFRCLSASSRPLSVPVPPLSTVANVLFSKYLLRFLTWQPPFTNTTW